MTKNTLFQKLKAYKLVMGFLVVALLLGSGFVVRAYSSYGTDTAPKVVGESGSVVNIYESLVKEGTDPLDEPTLGALTSPDIQSRYLCVNDDCVYHLRQTFRSATTTIISIANPFLTPTSTSEVVVFTDDGGVKYTGATSTVIMARYMPTAPATTTYALDCGAATAAEATLPSWNLLGTASIATSTDVYLENGVTNSFGGVSTVTSTPKILLTPAKPFFVCLVTPTVAAAFTESNRAFTGEMTIQVTRTK